MGRALWLPDVLADEFRGSKGFRVDVYPGWATRGSTLFWPEGVMDHHTGGGAYNNLLRYMAEGPVHPPLCNCATSRPYNGIVRITVVAAGRANHAGRGELPWRRGQGSTGNPRTIGCEHQNDGFQSWPAQQVEAMRRVDAALLRHMGKDTDWMLDHKTYTPRKGDRHTLALSTERREVAKLLRSPAPTPTPSPTPQSSEEDEVLVVIEGSKTAYHLMGRMLVPLEVEHAEDIGGPDWRKKVKVLTRARAAKYEVIPEETISVLRRFGELLSPSGSDPDKMTSVQGAVMGGLNAFLYLKDKHEPRLHTRARYSPDA